MSDDRVTAEAFSDDSTETTWREIEVELVDGERAVLDDAAEALVAAGATSASAASKLERALGDRVPRQGTAATTGKNATAADVVMAHVRAQVERLKRADPGVRVDAPDAVHQMRVACRRLRSAFKTFRPVLDRDRTDHVRDELRWIAGVLGDARDAEVMHARLRGAVTDDTDDTNDNEALSRIDRELGSRYTEAHRASVQAMSSERYERLIDALDAVLADPPLTTKATEPARQVLPPLAGRAFQAMRRDHDDAAAAPTPEERETALHEVRKAAKRARYAGEALTPAFGTKAKRFAAAMEQVQDVLGDHHDIVVTQQTLADMAARAHAAGEDTFELGRIAGREAARLVDADKAYRKAWKRASKKKLRRWTR